MTEDEKQQVLEALRVALAEEIPALVAELRAQMRAEGDSLRVPTVFIFFCYACAKDVIPGFLSTAGLCPHCGSIGRPLYDAETQLPIIASSERGREIAVSLGYTQQELAELFC